MVLRRKLIETGNVLVKANRSPRRHARFDTLRLHLVKPAATIVEKTIRIVMTLPAPGHIPRKQTVTAI